MAFPDRNFPEGVRFNVKEDTVVKYCCEEAPFVLNGFVDEELQEAFDAGTAADDELKTAQENDDLGAPGISGQQL